MLDLVIVPDTMSADMAIVDTWDTSKVVHRAVLAWCHVGKTGNLPHDEPMEGIVGERPRAWKLSEKEL